MQGEKENHPSCGLGWEQCWDSVKCFQEDSVHCVSSSFFVLQPCILVNRLMSHHKEGEILENSVGLHHSAVVKQSMERLVAGLQPPLPRLAGYGECC